jgi:hypothetical protein
MQPPNADLTHETKGTPQCANTPVRSSNMPDIISSIMLKVSATHHVIGVKGVEAVHVRPRVTARRTSGGEGAETSFD